MLEELKILNGDISIKFDPLNTKYTVILDDKENELNIDYKLKENTNIEITGNYNLENGSEVVIKVFDDHHSVSYYINVYKNNTQEVNSSIEDLINLEVKPKEISTYAGPGIASVCFLLILFLFVFLFHKRRSK